MESYFRFITIIFMAILLSACQLTGFQNGPQSQPSPENKVVIVEQPPKMVSTDWKTILSPLIDELLQTTEIGENNQLLISDVKNNSNHYISSPKINSTILNLMGQQDIFSIIDKQIITQAKQNLGIPYDDALISRSKMISLARHIKVDYVLFTTINQVPKLPDTQADVLMELLLVKTGEIVWQFSNKQLAENQPDN